MILIEFIVGVKTYMEVSSETSDITLGVYYLYMKLMIYLISNEQGMKREEATKYYVFCVFV